MTSSRRSRAARAQPQGRAAVMGALLKAGAELFAEKGPAMASVREIAERAGVNHGLVHRHYGSKEGLLRAVLDGLAGQIEAESGRDLDRQGHDEEPELHRLLERAFVAVTRHPAYFQVLARALLDGRVPEGLQTRFPVVERLVKAAQQARRIGRLPSGVEPRMAVAATVALGLGWLMFEPYLLAATGQRRLTAQTARHQLVETLQALLAPVSSDENEAASL